MTIETKDILAAIEGVKTSVGERFEKLEREQKEFDEILKEIALKSGRPPLGTQSGPDQGEVKALNAAVRALVMGDQQKANTLFFEAKAMNAGTGPDGGYVVHPVLSSGMTKVMAEVSPFYRNARVITMTQGDSFVEPIDRDSAEAVWVGEQTDRDDTDTPQLGEFTVPLAEIYAMPKITQKLIDVASINMLQWLSGKVGDAFGVTEGAAFHSGNGVARPHGILEYSTSSAPDSSRAWGTIQYVATGASGAFPTSSTTVNPADVLVDVVSAMRAQYRLGAKWYMNRATAGVVRKLKDADGRHVWVDSLVQGEPSILLGYPVEIDEDMPNIGANTMSIAFANLAKAYTIIEMPGAKFLTDPYTAKPHVRLYAYRRVGGGMNNSEAIKFLKFGTS
jgi:HK97 family phage major capsid protein